MDEHKALAQLRFEAPLTEEDVWHSGQAHVRGLHRAAQQMVMDRVRDASRSNGPSPIGVVLSGRAGAGKTHILGWVRQQMAREGGYFFLSNLGDGSGFWANASEALLQGLGRDGEDGLSQLSTFLRRLCTAAGVLPSLTDAIIGNAPLTPGGLDEFVGSLRGLNRQVAMECQDAARALALAASVDVREANVGYDYLTSSGEMREEDRRRWGFRAKPHEARRVVSDVSKLLGLTGPSVVAIDQIDTLVTLAQKSAVAGVVDRQIAEIADGLMHLREVTRRTLTIVACLPQSWTLIETTATASVPDRFTLAPELSRITDVELGRELVTARLGQAYERIGFTPPHPTWPVAPSAFDDVKAYTPRQVLTSISQHAQTCVQRGKVTELTSFAESFGEESVTLPAPTPDVDYELFDTRFAKLKQDADILAPLNPDLENRVMPALLFAGLTAWVTERGPGQSWSVDPAPGAKPPLHARLRLILDKETDDQAHWSFRAIAHPRAQGAFPRLDKACDAAGINLGVPGRALILIRNIDWSRGQETRRLLSNVEKTGGASVPITEDDLRTFHALRQMLSEAKPGLSDWLIAQRPASRTELFSAVLPVDVEALIEDAEPVRSTQPADDSDGAARVPVGRLLADQSSVSVPLESLRKHVVIFAGSGSGKTVLIRRLVEECALLGVSSIVLDPNSDLARLGDAWPELPVAEDKDKADEYLRDTDVVVWTPGRPGGRPLAFEPLPDFASVLDNADEFEFAVREAAAALAPRARVDGNTDKAKWGKAVLTQAIEHYARCGGRSMTGLINILTDLPEGVSNLTGAASIAAPLAQSLRAEMVNDPLLDDKIDKIDPGVLFTPAAGKRARVSVINLEALAAPEQKQIFVNQLQLELFSWVKRNPAGDRPLGGLLVMDEAQELAPATGKTPSTASSIRLAQQARKFGLGLILATQAPKAIHNQVSGNATTQFFGRLNHPTHIEAARDLARAKGRDLPDLGRLSAAEFYVTGEGIAFQKVRTPWCLTHHPRSALTSDEIIDRARRNNE
ncbi:ATP-binding protein [Kibdelosporangium aridum]|uniref:DNA helicase HerA, contains HAS-barrel and ATPase domains n=1 Tax=Kibdelosporangium aridum TaxID=2030 RepID=A0A1W2E8Q5_KIBAR|nr:ATP-binding protein [Kibdelosporangium aridum]SMD06159.1 DNA helicase HerA, contains HAS-barrel and ATPase domains [Kibdelosporangium aridum]